MSENVVVLPAETERNLIPQYFSENRDTAAVIVPNVDDDDKIFAGGEFVSVHRIYFLKDKILAPGPLYDTTGRYSELISYWLGREIPGTFTIRTAIEVWDDLGEVFVSEVDYLGPCTTEGIRKALSVISTPKE
jgi:hypothetical protein